MRNVWLIARQDLGHFLRQKATWLWVFVLPPISFFFIGSFGVGPSLGNTEQTISLVLEAPPESGFLADALASHLRTLAFDVTRLQPGEAMDANSDPSLRLVLPASFAAELMNGDTPRLELFRVPPGPSGDLAKLRVRRAVWSTKADFLVSSLRSDDLAGKPEEILAARGSLEIESRAFGERVEVPSGYAQAVPGLLVMFILLVLLTIGSSNLLAERRLGLLRRLASAPMRRSEVIVGKWAGRLGLAWIQIAFAMIVGTLLFDLDWGPDILSVVLILSAWGAFCSASGLLLGTLANTRGQAMGFGVLTTLVLAALGGCFWPIEMAPEWMQGVQMLLPSGWAMDAMHRLVSFQLGSASVLPHFLALFLTTFCLGYLVARELRYDVL